MESDHLLTDLKQAQRSLDELPNSLPIHGSEATIDVATVSAVLGQTITLLELNEKTLRLEEAAGLLRRMRTLLSIGDLAGAESTLVKVKAIVDTLTGSTF